MSDPIGYELVKELAVRRAGRAPVLVPQGWAWGANGPPMSVTSGIEVEGATGARVGVRLRQDPAWWHGWLRIDQLTVGQLYGASFGPWGQHTITAPGLTTAQDAADALVAALEGDGDFVGMGGVAQVTGLDSNIVLYKFPQPTPMFLDGVSQAGTPYASFVAEASTALWRLWGLGLGQTRWALLGGLRRTQGPWALEEVSVAGLSRVYVEVVRASGAVLPFVGPGQREDRADVLLQAASQTLSAQEAGLLAFPADAPVAVPVRVSAPEAAPSGWGDGVALDGAGAVLASVGALVGVTGYDLEAWVWTASGGWARANGGLWEALDGPWAERLEVGGALRFKLRVVATDGSLTTACELEV